MQRTFVVGCPRSGTTLVQAMLARHPDVFTLPETGFFVRLLGGLHYRWGDADAKPYKHKLARRLGFARRYGRRELVQLQQTLQGDIAQPRRAPWRESTCIARFVDMLDHMALKANRSMWIEKTPNHLLYLPEIENHLPDARFIHVIRPGVDVMASVTDANLRYDNSNAFSGGLVRWVQRWNRAANIHRQYIGERQHHFVFLEDLTRDPESEWKRLCTFLGLSQDVELDSACLQRIADPEREPWKHAALSGQPSQSDSKVEALFGPRLRDWLRERLSPYEELYAASSAAYDRADSFSTFELIRTGRPVEHVEATATPMVRKAASEHSQVA
jgi:hypothetical protein